MADYRIQVCRSCDRPIIWAVTTNSKSMPVDAAPTADGNVWLSGSPQAPIARVLTAGDQPFDNPADLRTSHFATCPDAGRWRTGARRAT